MTSQCMWCHMYILFLIVEEDDRHVVNLNTGLETSVPTWAEIMQKSVNQSTTKPHMKISITSNNNDYRIHVWHIYLQLVDFYCKCR